MNSSRNLEWWFSSLMLIHSYKYQSKVCCSHDHLQVLYTIWLEFECKVWRILRKTNPRLGHEQSNSGELLAWQLAAHCPWQGGNAMPHVAVEQGQRRRTHAWDGNVMVVKIVYIYPNTRLDFLYPFPKAASLPIHHRAPAPPSSPSPTATAVLSTPRWNPFSRSFLPLLHLVLYVPSNHESFCAVGWSRTSSPWPKHPTLAAVSAMAAGARG